MSAAEPEDIPNHTVFALINSVRDRSYDLFTFAEKQRMHDLVVCAKSKGIITPADYQWLRQSDDALRTMKISPAAILKAHRNG